MKKIYNRLTPEVYTKSYSFSNVISLFTVSLFFLILFLVLPKEKISQDEKRELAQFPKITLETIQSGEVAKNLSLYVNDHFPFRENFIAFANTMADLRGIKIDDVSIHNAPSSNAPSSSLENSQTSQSQDEINSSEISEKPQTSQEQSQSSEQSSQSQETDIGEQQGSTFIYKDRAMGLFGSDPKMGQWYASAINSYKKALGDDVKIYNIVVPTSIDFYIPEKYKHLTQPQKPSIDNIYSSLSNDIVTVDAYTKLEEHKDEYIYFRTDHHWTGLGAYYAYCAFAEKAGFEPVKIEDFETRRLDNFLGTLYSMTKDAKLKSNPDYVDYYMIDTPHETYRYVKNAPYSPVLSTIHGEYAVSPNSYSVFLHGDFPLTRIDTNIKNGRKIAVIKESYGNAFAPFLANHYEQVFVIDGRYFQLGLINFIKENGINELVFINNSMAANTPYHINNLEKMMYQQYVPVEETIASSSTPKSSSQEVSSSSEAFSSSEDESSEESSSKKSKKHKKNDDEEDW